MLVMEVINRLIGQIGHQKKNQTNKKQHSNYKLRCLFLCNVDFNELCDFTKAFDL